MISIPTQISDLARYETALSKTGITPAEIFQVGLSLDSHILNARGKRLQVSISRDIERFTSETETTLKHTKDMRVLSKKTIRKIKDQSPITPELSDKTHINESILHKKRVNQQTVITTEIGISYTISGDQLAPPPPSDNTTGHRRPSHREQNESVSDHSLSSLEKESSDLTISSTTPPSQPSRSEFPSADLSNTKTDEVSAHHSGPFLQESPPPHPEKSHETTSAFSERASTESPYEPVSNELTQALSAAPLPNQDNSSVQVAGYGCLEPFDKCQQSFTLASLGELQPTIEMSKHATEMGQAQATRAIVTTASGQVHVSTRCSQVKKTETLKASYSFETLPRALKIPYPRDTGQPSKAEGTSRQANLPDLTSEPRRYSASTSGYLRLTGEDTRGRSCQSSEITGDNDDWTSAGAEASTTTSPIKRVQFGENEYRTFVNKSKKHRHHHESSGYDPSMENWLPGRTARYDQTSVDHKKARHRPEANRQVPEISDQYGQLSDEPNDFSTSEPSVRPKKQPAEEEKTPNPDTFSETEPKYPLQEPGSHVSMDTSPTLEGYDSSSEYPFHADLEIKEPDHEFITVAGKVLPTGASKTYQLTERPLEPSSAHYNPLPDTLKKYWADKANERQLSPVNQDWSGAKEEKEPKGVSIQIDRAAVQYMRRAEAHYQYKQGQQDISLHRQLVTQARSGTLTIVQNPSDPKSDYHEVRLRLRAANHRHDNAFREIRMLRNYEEKVDSKRISTNASDIEKEFPKSRVMQNKEDEIIRKAVEAEKPVDKKLLKKLSLEGQSDLIKKRCAKLETAFRHESGEIKELQNHQLSLLQTLASQSRKEGRKDRFEKQWAKLERQQARYEQEKEGLLAWAEQGRQQMLRQEAVRRIQKGYSVMRDSDLTKSEHNKMENNLKEKEGRVAQAEQGDSRPFDKKFYRKETPL